MTNGPKVFGISEPDRVLLRAGIGLFLLGLLTGFAIPSLTVPRLGLSSHLEGVMNGVFLTVLGLMWGRLTLSPRLGTLTFAAAIYGAFANWAATLAAAALPAGAMMPIASGGAQGTPAAEAIVAILLASLSVAMLAVCAMALWGLRK